MRDDHGPECECSTCGDVFRQGRSLASVEGATSILVWCANLGLLLAIALLLYRFRVV